MSRGFLKMNGLGNDFVVVQGADDFKPTPEQVRAWASREGGVGFDQLIAISNDGQASPLVRFWNNDGEQVGVETAHGAFVGIDKTKRVRVSDKVFLSIRPEDLIAGGAGTNKISGKLDFAIFAGAAVEAEIACGDLKLFCLMGRDAAMTPGVPVSLTFASDVAVVLPRE